MNMKKMILATFCVLAVSCIAQNAFAKEAAANGSAASNTAEVAAPSANANEDGWDKVGEFFQRCVDAFCQSVSNGRVSGREGAIMSAGEGMKVALEGSEEKKSTNTNTNSNTNQGTPNSANGASRPTNPVYGREGAMMRAVEGFGAVLDRANAKAATRHAGSDK